MTISRDDIAAYLHTQFSALAGSVGQITTDASALGYGPDVDSALRQLGTAEGDLNTATATDANRDKVFALGEYYAARRFWRLLGDRVNHTMNETRFDFTDQRKNVKEMMEDAAKRLAVLGVDVTGDAWSMGYLNLDYIEPEDAL